MRKDAARRTPIPKLKAAARIKNRSRLRIRNLQVNDWYGTAVRCIAIRKPKANEGREEL
jgi:hypothetical protein